MSALDKITVIRSIGPLNLVREIRHGQGRFTTIRFHDRVVAEKHNGQTTTPVLQIEQIEALEKAGLPVSYDRTTFCWDTAQSILSEAS